MVDSNSSISVIALNVNCINTLIKRQMLLEQIISPNYMPLERYTLSRRIQKGRKYKDGRDTHFIALTPTLTKRKPNILTNLTLKGKMITKGKKKHFIMIKCLIQF